VLIRLLALALLLLVLWKLFRYAMGLRYEKLMREESRRALLAQGRRIVAELPLESGLEFVLEDADAFHWGGKSLRKREVAGARLLLNGASVAAAARGGGALPEAPAAEAYEGRERWEVVVYLDGARTHVIPCGTLREGVSREAAQQVFAAVKAAIE
jgi:hypothetical protein